jgi:DNA-directed RNA polymerase specialized sigma subunit
MNALDEFLLKEAKFRPFTPTTFNPMMGAVKQPLAPAEIKYDHGSGPSQADEIQMWKDWKKSGKDPEKLEPLMKSMNKIVKSTTNKFSGVDIPPQMVEAEAKRHMIEAIHDYNPNQGAKLSTHVYNRQLRVGRFVQKHQNLARVVESRAQRWGEYTTVRDQLTQELGRSPSASEIGKKMKVSTREAGRFIAEDRRDLVQTGLDQNAFVHVPTQDRIVLKMVEEDLTPEEKAVYERMFGFNGAPKQSPGQIAKSLRLHPSKVSRLSASISKKVEAYY